MAQETVQLDIVLSNGEKAGQTLGQLTAESRKLTKEIRSLKPGTEEFVKKSKDLQQVNGRVKEIKNEMYGTSQATKGVVSNFGQMLPFTGRFGQLANSIGGMRPALSGAASGSNMLGAAMKAIPILAIIGAITSLVQWFKRTEEGAQTLRVITAAVGQVFQSLMDIVSQVGKAIFSAVSNPKEAIAGLGNAIKDFLLSRVQLLISGFKGLGEAISLLFKGEFKAAAKEAGSSLIEITRATNPLAMAVEGVVNNADKMKEAFVGAYEEIKSDVQGAIALQQRENALMVAKREFIVREAELQAQMSELRRIGNDQTLTAVEREAALAKAMEIQKVLVGDRTRLAQEEYQIQKQRNALSDSTEADLMREAELQAAVINVRKQGEDEMRTIISMQSGLRKKLTAEEVKAAQEAAKAKAAAEEELQQRTLEGERALQELRIEIMEEGIDKEIATLNLGIDRKIEALTGTEAQITEQRLLLEHIREQGILAVQQEYKQKQLDAEKTKNQKIEEENKRRLEQQKADEEAAMQGTLGTFENVFGGLAGFFEQGSAEYKTFASLQVTLATAQAAIEAYKSTAAIPIVGPVLAPIAAASAAAFGLKQLQKINSAKKEKAPKTAKFAKGGILRGPSHRDGGIQFINPKDGQVNELEGDEIVLTAGVSRSAWGRALASNLNAAFGGRRFATGGPINPLSPGTTDMRNAAVTAGSGRNVEPLLERMISLENKFVMYANKMDSWPRQLQVVNNLQDTEEGLTDLATVRADSTF